MRQVTPILLLIVEIFTASPHGQLRELDAPIFDEFLILW